MENKCIQSALIGVLIGAAIGVTVGILIAPKSGKETREIIANKAISARDKAGEIIKGARERVSQMRQNAEMAEGDGSSAEP